MKKVTVAEAAEFFGVSKEAIHNRIRRGSLEVVIEDGVKMVLLDRDSAPVKKSRRTASVSAQRPSQNDRYYQMLEKQNAKLQERVDSLESETRSLRDQKEKMLIEEREKIERIYREKDEQMKQFFASIASQFALTRSSSSTEVQKKRPVISNVEPIETTVKVKKKEINIEELTSVKKFIKAFAKKEKCSLEKVQRIKKRFKKYSKKDKRIIVVDDKLYVDTKKYDYKDLLKW